MKFISILSVISIVVFTSCKPKDPNQQIDEGLVNKNTYTSNEIGWTINIPEGWSVTTREQNEQNQQKGLKAFENVIDEDIDLSRFKNLIGFQKNQFNSFSSTSEPFVEQYEGEWEENNTWLKMMMCSTFEQQGIKIDSSETYIELIDGLKFLTYEFTIYGPKGEAIMHQLMYTRLINGYDFGVNINYTNYDDKKELIDAWKSSKFKN